MFSSLIIYTISPAWVADLQAAEAALLRTPFKECGATQERSAGWVAPRGEDHGAMVESIGGHWIMRFFTEKKLIPADVLNRKIAEKADAIEQNTGRKPGKKERKDLKDEARLDLLPAAFTKRGAMWVWIDPAAGLLVLDTSSQTRADEVVTLLVDGLPGLAVALLDTKTSPQASMAHWLTSQEPPRGFSVDRCCTLKSADESKSVIRYARHPLDTDEVKGHIEAGKLPTELELTWDDRLTFLLTEGLHIKGAQFLEVVFEGRKGEDDSGFDADVAIATGELSRMIPDLIEALGGEGRTALGEGLPAAPHVTGTPPVDAYPSGAPF